MNKSAYILALLNFALAPLWGCNGSLFNTLLDDALPSPEPSIPVSLSGDFSAESEAESGSVTVVVTLSQATTEAANIQLSIDASTQADEGADFQLDSQSITVNAESTSFEVTVTVLEDSLAEHDEQVVLALDASGGIETDGATTTITIKDDDSPRLLSAASISATALTIEYNEPVTAQSAECSTSSECASIYSISGLVVSSATSDEGIGTDSDTYNLTTSSQVEGNTYTLTVTESIVSTVLTGATVNDTATDDSQDVTNTAQFNGDGYPQLSLDSSTVTECPGNANSRVVVAFDQAMAESGSGAVTSPGQWAITGCPSSDCATGNPQASASAIAWSSADNTATIDFPTPFDTDGSQYRLTGSALEDVNGNSVTGSITFQCGADTIGPILQSAEFLTDTTVRLVFSEEVQSGSGGTGAENTGNYQLDADGFGAGITSAVLSGTSVIITLSAALDSGGHFFTIQNITDTAGNAVVADGTSDKAVFIADIPEDFSSPLFEDPWGDGTATGLFFIYDDKLYTGPNSDQDAILQSTRDLTEIDIISLDADGASGSPYTAFTGSIPGLDEVTGIDFFYAACVGRGIESTLTGGDCSSAVGDDSNNGIEYLFLGTVNLSSSANNDTVYYTADSHPADDIFTFSNFEGLESDGQTVRLSDMLIFNEQLYVTVGDEGGGNPPQVSRVCVHATGCENGDAFGAITQLRGRFLPRIGKSGEFENSDNEGGNSFAQVDSMIAWDPDGSGANVPQLYFANGGWCASCNLANPRTGDPEVGDGGIIRTQAAYSVTTQHPAQCTDGTDCLTNYYEDMTPENVADWYNYASIPMPEFVNYGVDNDWDHLIPANTVTPSMEAIPYMREAPNGDLYLIRNACSTTIMQNESGNNGSVADFSDNGAQTCPPGSEVPQLWMLPSCATSLSCPPAQDEWILVAENTGGRTDMAGNIAECGSSPNKCDDNTHITLLEFMDGYLFIGYDNADFDGGGGDVGYGINIWKADVNSLSAGDVPTETDFSQVGDFGFDGDTSTGRIFRHRILNDGTINYLLVVAGDGINPVKIYRTTSAD